jgi:integrase/recombinase XerD
VLLFPPSDPRSSNGRTAAFGAVNRGSNPCRGATAIKLISLRWFIDALYEYWYNIRVSQANQTVVLYKRHTPNCKVHKSRLPHAARRFWMECGCPIWIVGRTPRGDLVPRQSTGFSDLAPAEAVRASLISQGKDESVHGPTVAECVERYIASRRHELGETTVGQYRVLLDRLTTFCVARRALYMRNLTADLLETFKTEGLPEDMADTSKATSVSKLRCFLRAAYRREWIKESLREKVTTHRAVYEQKEPYSDEEVEKILDEALELNGGTHAYAKHPKTFRLLLELMLETGMRVGDAIRYDPSVALKGEHLWIFTFVQQKRKKTDQPKPLETYLSDRLKIAIDECEWLSEKRPFLYGAFKNKSYLANEVYYRMQTIGERCGVEDCRPHRLRDTFAVRKLLAGFQLEDVSRLLGHSSVKVTETYYAKWVTSRKRRLERLVAESLVNA